MLSGVITLADGESYVINATSAIRITVISSAAGSGNVSRVDSQDADADSVDAWNDTAVAAGAIEVIEVDWPYYRISASGGSIRFAIV